VCINCKSYFWDAVAKSDGREFAWGQGTEAQNPRGERVNVADVEICQIHSTCELFTVCIVIQCKNEHACNHAGDPDYDPGN